MARDPELLIIGHKNPDTDSICSALAYAAYKREIHEVRGRPYRAGNVNPQTDYVLRQAGIDPPPLLTDVYPKLRDIMIPRSELVTLHPKQPLALARDLLLRHRFTFLPVVDDADRCFGMVTTLALTELSQSIGGIDGRELEVDLAYLRSQLAPADSSSERWSPEPSSDRKDARTPADSLFRATVRLVGTSERDGSTAGELPEHPEGPALFLWPAGAGLVPESVVRPGDVVVVCGAQSGESTEHDAALPDVEVIPSCADIVQSAVSVVLARTLEAFTVSPEPVFSPTDRVLDVQKEIAQYNQGGFIVAEEDGCIAGVITRISFLSETRFNVTLVDHNELSQSIEGIEHADVVEIIDHHRIGTRSTDSPITFINRVVGCTCTIIAEMYRSRGEAPDATTALLMLAAILSDTVILRSPTTTDADRGAAEWLAEIAGVNPESFGKAMFEAGSVIATKPADELVSQDRKSYAEGAYSFSVSQIETVGFEAFHARSEELQRALDAVVQEGGYDFGCLMVTDITEECTLLLFCGPERIREAIDYPELERGIYELSGVLSRKKQLLPYFVDMLRRLEG